MKRKIRNVLLLTAVIVMCFSVTVLAGEKSANGVSLGGDSVTTPYDFVATAQKTNSGGKVKSALSGHYVKDSDGNPAAPLYQQVNLTQTP